jgi:hypothetical protein
MQNQSTKIALGAGVEATREPTGGLPILWSLSAKNLRWIIFDTDLPLI